MTRPVSQFLSPRAAMTGIERRILAADRGFGPGAGVRAVPNHAGHTVSTAQRLWSARWPAIHDKLKRIHSDQQSNWRMLGLQTLKDETATRGSALLELPRRHASWMTASQRGKLMTFLAQSFRDPKRFAPFVTRYQSLLSQSDLRGLSLDGLTLDALIANRACLNDTSFKGGRFPGALLDETFGARTDFSESRLIDATLRYAHLPQAKLDRVFGRRLDLHWTRLPGASLRGIFCLDATLEGAVLHGADLSGGVYYRTDFTGADLKGANVEGASFRDCEGLDLTGTVGKAKVLYHQPDEPAEERFLVMNADGELEDPSLWFLE